MSHIHDTGDYKAGRNDAFTVDPRGLLVDWKKNLSRNGEEPPVDDDLKALALDMLPRKGASDTEDGSSGQLNPILVRSLSDRRLEVIGGFRRMRAALWLIESSTCSDFRVKYVISKMNDTEAALANLSENINRTGLSAVQLGHAVRSLHEDYGMAYKTIASRLKQSEGWLRQTEDLTGLPSDIQNSIQSGETTVTAGIELTKVNGSVAQHEVFNEAKTTGGKKVGAAHVKEAARKRQEEKADSEETAKPAIVRRSLKEVRAFLEGKTGPAEDDCGIKFAKTMLAFLDGKPHSEKKFHLVWDSCFPVPPNADQINPEPAKKAKKAS